MRPRFEPIAACFKAHTGFAIVALLASIAATPAVAAGIDWSKAPEKELTLFYPGQASWEWELTVDDHSGAKKFREGKNCKSCHEGEQKDMGQKIVTGTKLEPARPADKPGSLALGVRVARDDERLYFKLRWHSAASPAADADHPERVTVMFDDGQIKEAARAGCWASCHDDAIGMASATKDAEFTKYLGISRSKLARSGGGANFKPEAELQSLLQQGKVLEFWQARMGVGQTAQGVGGYILEKRHELTNAGVTAQAELKDGEWNIVLSRALKPSLPGQKELAAGRPFTIGFAVHDARAEHRHHYVSFEQTLLLDSGSADFVATRP